MIDEEGFEFDVPDELRPWLDEQQRKMNERMGQLCKQWILVDGKIKPATLLEWAAWFGDFSKREIDRTDISAEPNYPDGEFVSTVFLGLDHGFDLTNERPILFETMVFGGKYSSCGWRYSSMADAKRGHWIIVDCIRAGNKPYVDFGERPIFEMFMEFFGQFDDDAENEENEE